MEMDVSERRQKVPSTVGIEEGKVKVKVKVKVEVKVRKEAKAE